jgi:F-type H+-transporting ATPase subunit b
MRNEGTMIARLCFALCVCGLLVAAPKSMAAGPDAGGPSAVHGESSPSGEEHSSADINPLSLKAIKADLAIWTGVVFVLLLLILWKFAWGPIVDGLDKRESRIAADIEAAKQANEEAKAQLAAYQEKLDSAGEEVQRMLGEARRDAEKLGEEIRDKARSDAQAEHQRALGEIELATSAAIKELAQHSADLAVELAGKIVHTRLDKAAHAQLIEEAVSNFGKAKASSN